LQESPELAAGDALVSLIQVLAGVSPDYAVVAQKTATAKKLKSFDAPFDQQYGLTLADLAMRYEASLRAEIICELKPKRRKPKAQAASDVRDAPKK
jgi:O-antigen chain-terminating methyltransferase